MGIKEKKQLKELEDSLNGKLGNGLKKAVDKPTLTMSVDADQSVDAEGLRIASYGITNEFVPAFIEVAKDDDYRAELAKINKVTFKIKPEIPKNLDLAIYCNMKLSGDTLTVTVDTTHSPGNGGPALLKQYIESLY